jgi:hypothetical protein
MTIGGACFRNVGARWWLNTLPSLNSQGKGFRGWRPSRSQHISPPRTKGVGQIMGALHGVRRYDLGGAMATLATHTLAR